MTLTVLVTGFGPFRDHKINASWEAVKLLPNYEIEGINWEIHEIPVIYTYIDEHVPLLWNKYKPKLVVHVGVSQYTECLKIETVAFRSGYEKTDCKGKLHRTGDVCCSEDGEECIKTLLDVNKICQEVRKEQKVKVCTSTDAGRYLCEFTYYKSLNIDKKRSLFVHVPPLERPYSDKEIADGLIGIIKCALKQIDDKEDKE